MHSVLLKHHHLLDQHVSFPYFTNRLCDSTIFDMDSIQMGTIWQTTWTLWTTKLVDFRKYSRISGSFQSKKEWDFSNTKLFNIKINSKAKIKHWTAYFKIVSYYDELKSDTIRIRLGPMLMIFTRDLKIMEVSIKLLSAGLTYHMAT